jgi:hypothetical protein
MKELDIIQFIHDNNISPIIHPPEEEQLSKNQLKNFNAYLNSSKIIYYDDIRDKLKGIGQRHWYIHSLNRSDGKFEKEKLALGLINAEIINERKR